MSKILFSPKQVLQLQKNPNVQQVSERTITYTDTFKSQFIDEYFAGKTPRQIFKEYGFDEEIIGIKLIEQSAFRWRKAYEENGLIGLTDTRKSGSGRPIKRELTAAEVIERQAARIQLLEGQVDLLKKLEATERRLLNDSQKLSTNKVFQLISDTLSQFPCKQMVTYFCDLLKVSKGIPGEVLLTDISYVPYNGKCMAYLSTIKDASTNEILAYHVSDRITLEIATETIEKLIRNKRVQLHPEAFIHSDQGVHYTSPRYQTLLKKHGLGQSMSRRGNCWDNAPQESFFGHFKDEVDLSSLKTLEELKAKINHYMVYYNNYRYQWNLKRMAPVQYRNHLLAA